MNYINVRNSWFWRRTRIAALRRLDESKFELAVEKNQARAVLLARIIRDDEERLEIAEDFVAKTRPERWTETQALQSEAA